MVVEDNLLTGTLNNYDSHGLIDDSTNCDLNACAMQPNDHEATEQFNRQNALNQYYLPPSYEEVTKTIESTNRIDSNIATLNNDDENRTNCSPNQSSDERREHDNNTRPMTFPLRRRYKDIVLNVQNTDAL